MQSGGSRLKAPEWAYGTFAYGPNVGGGTGYMPLNDLELSDGQGFEQGEQTAFMIGAGLMSPLAGPLEAQKWAWVSQGLGLGSGIRDIGWDCDEGDMHWNWFT